MERQGRNRTSGAVARDREKIAPRSSGQPEPIGYLTTESLASMWAERRREVDRHRQAHPDDLSGIEARQRIASQLLQTFRLLADLEQQLGIVLGVPVLGARSGEE